MPIPHGQIVSFECINGLPVDLRVSVPESEATVCFRIGQTQVWATLDRNAGETVENLREIIAKQSIVTAGVFHTSDGGALLRWLISGSQHDLIPLSREAVIARSWDQLARALPWLVVELGAGALCLFMLMQNFGWVILLVAVALGLMFTALLIAQGVLGLYSAWHDRRWYQQSEKALREARAQCNTPVLPLHAVKAHTDAPRRQSISLPEITSTPEDDIKPRLLHLACQANVLKMDAVSIGVQDAQVNFRRYHFKWHGQSFVFYTGKNLGDSRLFIAEGDRIEIVALAPDNIPDALGVRRGMPSSALPEALVYALRNLEDGTIYTSHQAMSQFSSAIAMTSMTRYGLARVRHSVMVVGVVVVLLFACLHPLSSGIPLGMPAFTALILVTAWIVFFEMPIYLWQLKWKLGYPSRRQRTTTRVYALLGIESPLHPPPWLVET